MHYCKLLTRVRYTDMSVNVNRSMMLGLTELKAGRGHLVCLPVTGYQTVIPLPCEFTGLWADIY